MPTVINLQTQEVEAVSADQAQALIQAGTHGYNPSELYDVVLPNGTRAEVTGDEAAKVSQLGGVGLVPNEVRAAELANQVREAQFGNIYSKAQTFAEGAFSTVVPGGTFLQTVTGERPEDIQTRQELNPISRVLGEATGFVVGPKLGGATVGGAASKLSGKAAERLSKLGEGRLASAVSGSAQGLIEGAVFGTNAGINDLVLSDDPITVDSVISNVGSQALYGALSGGLVGGVLGGLGGTGLVGGGRPAANAAEEAVKRTTIRESLRSTNRGIKRIVKDMDDATSELSKFARKLPDEEFNVSGVGHLEQTQSRFKEAFKEFKAFKPRKASPEEYKTVMGNLGTAMDEYEGALVGSMKKLGKNADDMEGLEQFLFAPGKTKAKVQDVLAGKSLPKLETTQAKIAEAETNLLGSKELMLELAAQGLEVDEIPVIGKPAEMLIHLALARRALGAARQSFGRGETAGALAKIAGDTGSKSLGRFAQIGNAPTVNSAVAGAVKKHLAQINKNIKTFVRKPSVRQVSTVAAANILGSSRFAPGKVTDTPQVKGLDKTQSLFIKRSNEVKRAVANEGQTRMGVRNKLGAIAQYDRATGERLENAAWQRISYLASTLPRFDFVNPLDRLQGLSNGSIIPPKSAIQGWAMRVRASENPNVLVEDLRNGTLVPETVETVRTLYPATFEQVRQSLIAEMVDIKRDLSYAEQQQLGLYFEVAFHPTMEPSFGGLIQQSLVPSEEEQEPPRPRLNISVGPDPFTEAQRIASGEE